MVVVTETFQPLLPLMADVPPTDAPPARREEEQEQAAMAAVSPGESFCNKMKVHLATHSATVPDSVLEGTLEMWEHADLMMYLRVTQSKYGTPRLANVCISVVASRSHYFVLLIGLVSLSFLVGIYGDGELEPDLHTWVVRQQQSFHDYMQGVESNERKPCAATDARMRMFVQIGFTKWFP